MSIQDNEELPFKKNITNAITVMSYDAKVGFSNYMGAVAMFSSYYFNIAFTCFNVSIVCFNITFVCFFITNLHYFFISIVKSPLRTYVLTYPFALAFNKVHGLS